MIVFYRVFPRIFSNNMTESKCTHTSREVFSELRINDHQTGQTNCLSPHACVHFLWHSFRRLSDFRSAKSQDRSFCKKNNMSSFWLCDLWFQMSLHGVVLHYAFTLHWYDGVVPCHLEEGTHYSRSLPAPPGHLKRWAAHSTWIL